MNFSCFHCMINAFSLAVFKHRTPHRQIGILHAKQSEGIITTKLTMYSYKEERYLRDTILHFFCRYKLSSTFGHGLNVIQITYRQTYNVKQIIRFRCWKITTLDSSEWGFRFSLTNLGCGIAW